MRAAWKTGRKRRSGWKILPDFTGAFGPQLSAPIGSHVTRKWHKPAGPPFSAALKQSAFRASNDRLAGQAPKGRSGQVEEQVLCDAEAFAGG
jgi:hypothetical protein